MSGPVKYSGAGWLWGAGYELSPLGERVADIIGQVFGGIYHMSTKDRKASTWSDPYCVVVRYRGALATYDSDRLTALVVLCHDARIRLDISARARNYLELMFHQRQAEGDFATRHPTLEENAASIRAELSLPIEAGEQP